MAVGQQVNTQRVITIAGAVALIAITAFGVWKWNKSTDLPPRNQGNDKKKPSVRQVVKGTSNDKVEKQSHKEEEEKVEVTHKEEVMIVKEIEKKENKKEEIVIVEQLVVIEEQSVPVATEEPAVAAAITARAAEAAEAAAAIELEKEIKDEFEEAIAELTADRHTASALEAEDYVVVAPTTITTLKQEESQSCTTSSTDETDVWTPEHEIISSINDDKNTPKEAAGAADKTTEEYIWKADATNNGEEVAKASDWSLNEKATATVADEQVVPTTTTTPKEEESTTTTTTTPTSGKPLSLYAPVFVPRQQQQVAQQQLKKSIKKRLSRTELIEQQRQNHTPHAKARCSHWPHCTNKNCKFWHPFKDCREGENCPFGNKCMFIHPSDYLEPVRQTPSPHNHKKQQHQTSPTNDLQQQPEELGSNSSSFIQQQQQPVEQQFQFTS